MNDRPNTSHEMSYVDRPQVPVSALYRGAAVVLATMHGKAQAIAPPFADHLSLIVKPSVGLDTDQLGTFSGEIPRQGTMLEVAVRKARLGMHAAGLPLGLASEGSFGSHPAVPFLPVGMELLVFVDEERGLAIHESLVDESTNFAHFVIIPGESVEPFLERVGFPAHGLIVRPNEGNPLPALTKGITDQAALEQAVREAGAISPDGAARLETDMRAHLNPTRMRSLGVLAERLARRVATLCPTCSAPGFGRTGTLSGLICEECDEPTEMVASEVFGCAACDHREVRVRSDGLSRAPARSCPLCNP
ncbi:DUF6671 family protein [Methylobacterium oryzisoli]|uniref:DUF6671 family protein n=1 Tax=Methylobacterium oryzisoli TaxID=3385502 RepID=UPI0038926F52